MNGAKRTQGVYGETRNRAQTSRADRANRSDRDALTPEPTRITQEKLNILYEHLRITRENLNIPQMTSNIPHFEPKIEVDPDAKAGLNNHENSERGEVPDYPSDCDRAALELAEAIYSLRCRCRNWRTAATAAFPPCAPPRAPSDPSAIGAAGR